MAVILTDEFHRLERPESRWQLHPEAAIERRRTLGILDRAIEAAAGKNERMTVAVLVEVKNQIERD